MPDRRACESIRRALIFLAASAALAFLSGCAVTRVNFADRQVEPYLKALTQKTAYPLARTLTWKYFYTVGAGRSQQAWLVADGQLVKDAKAVSALQWYAAQPVTSGVAMNEVYTARAREATRRGDHRTAQIYHGASAVSVQTQIANEQVAAGMALGSAIQGLGAALLDATIVGHGQGAAEYVSAPERGIIGGAAPDGAVLELFFRGVRLDGADATPSGTTTMRWETVATLKDAEGKIWRSAASFTYYHVFVKDSDPKPPAVFSDGAYMQMVPGTLIPAHNRDFVPEEDEMKKIWARSGAAEFGITAMQAIGDLYAQISMAKGARR